MLTDIILANIDKEIASEEAGNPIRLSNSGKCARQLAYKMHGFPTSPLPSRTKLNFAYGHRVEDLLVEYCEKYGNISVNDRQLEVKLLILGKEILGHIDGTAMLKTANSESEFYKKRLLEFKSYSAIGFNLTESVGIDYGYLCQANIYMYLLGLDECLFVYLNKNIGDIGEKLIKYDASLTEEIKQRWVKVLSSSPSLLPDREHEPTKKGCLVWQCSYCNCKDNCWKTTMKIEKGKPVFYVEGKKEVEHANI